MIALNDSDIASSVASARVLALGAIDLILRGRPILSCCNGWSWPGLDLLALTDGVMEWPAS